VTNDRRDSHLLEDAKKIESALERLGPAGATLKTDIKCATEVAGKLVKALDNDDISKAGSGMGSRQRRTMHCHAFKLG